jgi:hypothetical protein
MPIESVTKRDDVIEFMLEGGGNFTFVFDNDTIVTHTVSGNEDTYICTNPSFNIMIDSDTMMLSHNTDYATFVESIDFPLIQTLKNILNRLNIASAPHIGVLTEGTDITITDRNSVSLDDFEDGEECVLIRHPNGNFTLTSGERCFVYHIPSLQGWLDAGNTSEPLTRVPITQAMLQRFRYSKPAGGGAGAGGEATGASRKRKSKKSRKTRRSRN